MSAITLPATDRFTRGATRNRAVDAIGAIEAIGPRTRGGAQAGRRPR